MTIDIHTLLFLYIIVQSFAVSANRPDLIVLPIANQTVPLGRDATFTCVVRNLSGYRIGWVKTDSKAIQAIHDHVITHNPRVWVSTTDQSTWNLHIKSVQEDDRGQYMCQINTDPMISQTGYLDVVIPPDIINDESSGDMMVPEGESVRLSCKAKGYPQPQITWRREDGGEIMLKDSSGAKEKARTFEGEDLRLTRLSRNEMGAYLCIASNGIPPSVSKRIIINVHFHPVIQVPNQLVGAPFGTNVTLECYVEAYPKPIIYWEKKKDEMLVSNEKYEIVTEVRSQFETKMTLKVKYFHRSDMGTYKCNAKNSVGGVESSIRLYEITGATKYPYIVDEDDMEPVDNHKNEHKGYSLYPKYTHNANKVNNSTKLSPNRSLILHYRSYVERLFTFSTIIVTASVTKLLTNL